MKVFRAFCAALILIMPIIAHAQGAIIPASGDTTGKTDGAAINAALSANLSATLACNSHYYTNVTIQVVGGAKFVGCGINTLITGVGTITGGIVKISPASTDQNAGQLVGNFQIAGGTATNAVLAGGSTNTGPAVNVHLFNIWVSGGNYTDVFWFNTFFNNQVDNLGANVALGSTLSVSASCFHLDGQVNADTFNTLEADCGAPYGFYMQNDNEASGSAGDTFNGLSAEGGCSAGGTSATCAGLYVGAGYSASTFNGLYTENVLHPVVLGNNAASHSCSSLTFNNPALGGPAVVGSNQVALVDIDDCMGVTIVSPAFSIYPIGQAAPLTFSGGGCTTEPTAVAIPNPAGIVKAVTLIYAGAGCTSAPTIVVGGSGSGASVTAAESGGTVTGLTLASGGTGYTLPADAILPIVYNNVQRTSSVINPFCNDGSHGNNSPCWAWIVHASGAASGIEVEGDELPTPSGTHPANLIYTASGNQHYLSYLDSSGATHLLSVVPQTYP